MAFRLPHDASPAGDDGREAQIRRWQQQLLTGEPSQRASAAMELAKLGAEEALVECLKSGDDLSSRLATQGLWEWWLNERGAAARVEIDRGIKKMEAGNLESALETFGKLVKKYPDWAEAHNKQATVLYMLGNPRLSYKVCEVVVELKPCHFGAWNGLALCAARLERWRDALRAARQALALQPGAQSNLDLIQLAESKLRDGE
jgi:Flp pilus assembly protein TadD